MRNLVITIILCLHCLCMCGQKAAVLEFKAGVGISQTDVDGISAIFITYFHPDSYTMVERSQIDKVITEQGFQYTDITENNVVNIGRILNVSKVVVGDVNVIMKQYNVDVRVIDVETGSVDASDGVTFDIGTSYRSTMKSLSQSLAKKISVSRSELQVSRPKQRDTIAILYGYLRIYPHEIGDFDREPKTIIRQINLQSQFGYNNWRVPTNEELSLLKANNYLSNTLKYLTKESPTGRVLLVSTKESSIDFSGYDLYYYNDVPVKPTFQGGDMNSFSRWINGELVYPTDAIASHVGGKVTISFIIEPDGSVTNVKVRNCNFTSLGEEAMRVISMSPKWKAGENSKGEVVRVWQIVPIIFQI